MTNFSYKIFPIAEDAATINFGNTISQELNNLIIQLSQQIENNNFIGFIECVPAYSSLTIFYNTLTVKQKYRDFLTAFEAVKNITEKELKLLDTKPKTDARHVEIPVSFDLKHAPDLESVAEINQLSCKEIKDIFLAETYRVYMLGFLPGFPYMGKLNKKIATPRKTTPRKHIPKGSVGIAGEQTGIYPLDSPGGWQIIGKTDTELFTPSAASPSFLQVGDLIKFVEV